MQLMDPLELMQQGRYEEAIELWQSQYKKEPANLAVISNLGVALTYVLRLEEAISLYRYALARFPSQQHSDAIRWNLATPLLMLGQFLEGFALYEYRTQVGPGAQKRKPSTPLWQGEKALGKTLYIQCREGLGDMIQFSRYIPYISSHVRRIILEMPPDLHPLFSHLGVHLIAPHRTFPPHDLHLEIMSFPYLFQTDLSTIPPPISIASPPLRPQQNQVGIVWRGNPRTARDRHRSIPLPTLTPLFHLPHIRYISLQKDPTPEEIALLNRHHVHIPPLATITDTLQALSTCERIIAVDTMIAHLAGSLHIPTWLFTSYVPEWRWLLDRTDSPWYPSITLVRQLALDRWEDPIAHMCLVL